MKTQPIAPAHIDWGTGPDAVPRSPLYDDVYHPQAGALTQARHVFLQGNGLPQRWAGRAAFTVLETGFGLGHNFLATWDAWRRDPARCERLFFVSIDRHPPTAADLQRAHAAFPLPELAQTLQQAWPPLTPNLHLLPFEGGRVQLLLALGDIAALLPALRLRADAFFLDGFAPARNPAMWQPRVMKALAALAAPGATLATWSAASALRADLATAGFVPRLAPGTGGKREITLADWAPRFTPRRPPSAAVAGREALVVGAGLAGAAAAQALARLGWRVTVFDRHAAPAAETSGNPAGLFHGTVNADDGPYARLFRSAALLARAEYAAAIATGRVPGRTDGLLRLVQDEGGLAAMQALLQRLRLPRDYVDALPADAAAARAGVPLAHPAWHYPGGGWVAPSAWAQHALNEPGVRFVGGAEVGSLTRPGDAWQLHDTAGRVLAQAPTLVLANAATAAQLLAPLGHAPWPLRHSRGQVTHWAGATALQLPVAGDGYAIPMRGPATTEGLLCGATREAVEPATTGDAPALRDEDHVHNLRRLQRLTGLQPPADAALWRGRAGWRLHSDDRLPIAGALPCARMPAGQRLDQARLLPRENGLFVLTALGARGLTLAPLLARLVAAQASGTPWPLEQDLADAVDPARWLVRAARAAPSGRRTQPCSLQPAG
ncbi:MAG: FAD-dependent 5-carboxymethylaminomethyl-2-thiouridine(34) oxidoreductase MnmC [Betaproteobacteria bacterium]|nr:FAD-dependent 5-carboxymethylaminomethyl-2-thiouridine(34) oxidoreductase MnmC [Betaproteobacteria bacterium]